MSSRHILRQKIIQERQLLTLQQRKSAAHQVAKHLFNSTLFLRSRRIAFYLPVNGELDSQPIMAHALTMKKLCYLPVLHPLQHNRLQFIAYEPGDELIPNRYGILEPKIQTQKLLLPAALDLVLTPLVSFDLKGNRLGMGGGYYDRTFHFLKRRIINHRPPYLIGLAYEFQKVETITCEAWDVPLHSVVTETQLYRINYNI